MAGNRKSGLNLRTDYRRKPHTLAMVSVENFVLIWFLPLGILNRGGEFFDWPGLNLTSLDSSALKKTD